MILQTQRQQNHLWVSDWSTEPSMGIWLVTCDWLADLGSIHTWRQRCVFSVVMCEQLHWWQCNPSLTTCLQCQKSVSLLPSANGTLVFKFILSASQFCRWLKIWNFTHQAKTLVDLRGGRQGCMSPGSKFFHFHAVFCKKRLAYPFLELLPQSGKFWIHHC